MSESKMDRYFRREDTLIAKALKKISALEGSPYRLCTTKRAMELLIAVPLAIATTPLVATLATLNKFTGDAFFVQERIRKEGRSLPVIKIRCIYPGSDKDIQASLNNEATYGASGDPRNTPLGKVLRKYEIEEFPQLWQVAMGQWSLFGIRSAPQYVFDHIEQTRPASFEEWTKAYFSGIPGVISLNAVCNPKRKNDSDRHHYDLLYSKRASLGLDLYILYRLSSKVAGSIAKSISARLEGVEPPTVTSEA